MERIVRQKLGVARLSLASNTALVILKLAVGLWGGAISVVSEAVHSAVDLVASAIAYCAVRHADKPPDGQHSYGHGKFENLSGFAESILMILVALWIICEAAEKFSEPFAPEFLEYGMGVMILSGVISWMVSAKMLKVAGETNSQALAAEALHLRTDVWTSLGVLAGLGATRLSGLPWFDPAIAIAVAALILKAGFKMLRKSLSELTDECLPQEDEEIIRRILEEHPEVIAFHRLRTRRSGSRRLIDVSIYLNKSMHLDKAHAVCDEIEAKIAARFTPCDTVIHLEPYSINPF